MTIKPQPESAEPATQEQEPSQPPAPPSQPDASKLELFLPAKTTEAAEPAAPTAPEHRSVPAGLRSARLLSASAHRALVQLRGEHEPRDVALDADVDSAVVRDALETGDRVMVELDEDGQLVLVGVLRCRQPDTIRLRAGVVEIEADRELLLRSGKGAMRIREDGDVELVGSRISAASRGLFRLVGKMLRLN